MRRILSVFLVALTAATAVATGARADDATESRFFDGAARSAYEHRRWAEALEAFLRAYRAAPSARTLYNIAVCAQLSHRGPMAFAYFDEFLAQPDADPALRADALTRRNALAQVLALVHVESEPPGAAIYVDRRDLGAFGTTPRTLALTPGSHHVEFVLANHATASVDVQAVVVGGDVSGAASGVRVTLAPHEGQLTVEAAPATATLVARRGDSEAVMTAGQTATLPVGTYTVVASAPGYREATVEVRLVRGAAERRVLTLEALPVPVGRVLVTTGDVPSRVRIDGRDRAEAPARLEGVSVGAHEIIVSAPGYRDWTGTVTVADGHTTFVAVTLVRVR